MKYNHWIKSLIFSLSAIASTALMNLSQTNAQTVSFQEQQVNQGEFNIVAVPFGYQQYRLEILEQIPGKPPCWAESATTPGQIDLLLLNFDYTDSCRRFVDTNGYTLRVNGVDETMAYVIKIVPLASGLQLLAIHKDPTQPSIIIGTADGKSDRAVKINFNPGWQITKRVYQGQVLNHIYLSGNLGTSIGNHLNSGSIPINNQEFFPRLQNVDTQTLVNNVEQIYNNVLTPILYNLSQEANNSNN